MPSLLPSSCFARRPASPFAVAACTLLALGALAWTPAAGAKTEPNTEPTPRPLWRNFPLSPRVPLNPRAQPARHRSPGGKGSAAERQAAGSSQERDSWSSMVAIAATVGALGLAFAFAPAALVRARRARVARQAPRGHGLRRAPKTVVQLEPRLRQRRPPVPARDVVEDLLQAVGGGAAPAVPAEHRPSLAAATTEPQAHAPSDDSGEVELLRAKTGGEKHDVDVLKAKLTADAAQARTLKEKLRAHDASHRAEREPPPQRAATPKKPAPPPEREPTVAPPPPATIASAAECRIALWRGYVTSRFHAALVGLDGEERVVARSPAFRWRSPGPPPQHRPGVWNAHRALIEQLEAAGWSRSGQDGGEWFALGFRRGDAAATETKHPPGRRP